MHFSAIDSHREQLQLEWNIIKHIKVKDISELSTRAVTQFIASDNTIKELYPDLSRLCSIALVLPVSTTDCETGFSTFKQIRTVPWNRLTTATLDKLILISSKSPG